VNISGGPIGEVGDHQFWEASIADSITQYF